MPVEVPDQHATESDAKVPEPVRQAKAVEQTPSSKKLSTLIQASDAVPGSSGYLSRVQDKISKHWMAPPVDLSGQSLVVVIKFRLHRSGTVSDVVVEQPSGNHYYDLVAERAIRSADPLPAFPGSLSEVYLDTHFTFTVGEQAG
jgi:colicin import membrane protein